MERSWNVKIIKKKTLVQNVSSSRPISVDNDADFPPLPISENLKVKKVESDGSNNTRHNSVANFRTSSSVTSEIVGEVSTVSDNRKSQTADSRNSSYGCSEKLQSEKVVLFECDSNTEGNSAHMSKTTQELASSKQQLHKAPKQKLRKKGKRNRNNVLTEYTCEEKDLNSPGRDFVANISSREEYPELLQSTDNHSDASSVISGAKTKGKPQFVRLTTSTVPGNVTHNSLLYRNSTASTFGWISSTSFSDVLKATTVASSSLKFKNSNILDTGKSHKSNSEENSAFLQKAVKDKKSDVSSSLRIQQKAEGKERCSSVGSKKPEAKKTPKKSQNVIPFNLSDFIIGSNSSNCGKIKKRKDKAKILDKKASVIAPHNMLDATAPLRKRGKERELPKTKQLSALKKIILKERELKKNKLNKALMQLPETLTDGLQNVTLRDHMQDPQENNGKKESDTCEDCEIPKENPCREMEELECVESKKSAVAKEMLHGRYFREYCDQLLSEDIDSLMSSLLSELVRFQDRLYQKDPIKAKAKKRLVCGLKEVTKHLKMKKIKVLIITPDVEKINSEGGLDDKLGTILQFSTEYRIPCIFGLKRRKVGNILKKKVPVCCVGIFSYEGAEQTYKQLMEKVEEAKTAYKEYLQSICNALKPELITSVEQPISANEKQELWKKIADGAPPKLKFTSQLVSEIKEE